MATIQSSSPAPRISIVMAAYNEEADIGRALDSIIAQTFVDWELIVIDDGSQDSTAEIVRSYAAKDSRIKLVCNATNLALPASLNIGIRLARADLIARADADDVNLPERLERQYEHLQTHDSVDVLGTAAYLLDKAGKRVSAVALPLTHADLERLPFIKIPFFHPSVVIRKRFFDSAGLYDPHYPNAEDKELWVRGLNAGCCYANLPDKLIEYSTDGYVKGWRSIMRHGLSLLRIVRTYRIKRGYLGVFLLFGYSVAIKLRVVAPKSLRLN